MLKRKSWGMRCHWSGLWKTLMCSWEFIRPHCRCRLFAYWGLCTWTVKIWEGPKLLPLAGLEALCKEEIKAKGELSISWPNGEGMPCVHWKLQNIISWKKLKKTSINRHPVSQWDTISCPLGCHNKKDGQ